MRQDKLAKTIAALIAITAGAIQPAQALNLNPNGVGQVLIYPYYTVNGGNQTLFSVVNKTAAGKAIKVRFREGRNAREALSFNIYLSPFDVWTGTLFSLSDIGPSNPASLLTGDDSCTVPRIKRSQSLPPLANGTRYVSFFNFAYTGSYNDSGPDTRDRTREGYFELIEMGEVVNREDSSLSAISHGSDGLPMNCIKIERAWMPLGTASPEITYWSVNALVDMAPPGGGLFGSAAIIDTLGGTMLSYDAEAIGAFSDSVQHRAPGSPEPSLASAQSNNGAATIAATVFRNGAVVTSYYPVERPIDAVSALFAQDALFNEFSSGANFAAASEWIVTFPTKYAYTDETIVGASALPPFTRIFPTIAAPTNGGFAAVDIDVHYFNREEAGGPVFCDPADPFCSPFEPPPVPNPQLLWATNVIGFNQSSIASAGSTIMGSRLTTNISAFELGIVDGWARLGLYAPIPQSGSLAAQHRLRSDDAGGSWLGLPAFGFSVTSYTNGQLTPGTLSNYADISRLRASNRYELTPLPGVLFKDAFEALPPWPPLD